jgi:hypothetical protein
MARIQNIRELQGVMPGVASKREAKKLAEVLLRHGLQDTEEVQALSNEALEDCMAESEGE